MEPKRKERFDDEWLDAALMQYGRVEPRPGLENRVLASLQAEREYVNSPGWRWWPAVAALTAVAMITVAVFVAQLNRHRAQAPVANEIVVPAEMKTPEPSRMKQPPATEGIRAHVTRPRRHMEVEFISEKKERFPSPEPLSEQEQMLSRYIERFPREATVMARAQTELTRQEIFEQMDTEIVPSSDQQNQ